MDRTLPVLKVHLFGAEKITYGDTPILGGRNSVTKATKLLLILLYRGSEGIGRRKLLDDLFGREELANASNNLRVTMHRLKKMLVESGLPEHEYIVAKDGMYYWNSPFETEVDVVVFKGLIKSAGEETNRQIRLTMLKEACRMYTGEFLQKLSGDEWVLIESVQCKNLYAHALQHVCELLMADREYEEILRIVDPACKMYPFDEWQAYKIEAYIAMNRYKDALKEYEATAKVLIEELGVSPSKKMLEQFKVLSSHITNQPQAIDDIKGGLREEARESGAFYCTLPGFRDAYRMIRRGMERNGQSVFLLVCTLVDGKGRPMESSDRQTEMADALFKAIKSALRRSDSFTKYNQSQYLAMLMGTNEENCQIVIDRICAKLSLEHKAWVHNVQFSVTSLYDADFI